VNYHLIIKAERSETMAHRSPRDRMKVISQKELEEGLQEQALERFFAEAAEEAGLPNPDAPCPKDSRLSEGRLIYDKFDSRPR